MTPSLHGIDWLAILATCPTTGSKDTYVNGANGDSVVYLPGLMTDNPGLDVEEYRKQLAHLDPVTRKQLEEGDWDVQLSGGVLDVSKLKYYYLEGRIQATCPVLGLRRDGAERGC